MLDQSAHSSALSSPFMAKLSIANQNGKKSTRPQQPPQPPHADGIFPAHNVEMTTVVRSTPPASPPPSGPSSAITAGAGGEMERIRQSAMQDRLAQLREAEKRRPEYLKRAKRTLSDADPEEELPERDRALAVGIMESPHKGRRLKLFQETSEESFEESLMAGGYGRYRTADWVRQPQPIALPSSAIAGSSTIVEILEEAEPAPPTEKELKKRRRLAAFRSEASQNQSKLCAVELEGKGRVLIDVPTEEPPLPMSPEPSPKKRVNNRRKKKGVEVVVNKKTLGSSSVVDDQAEKPNWPDTEFPWRLRTEERLELAKAEEEDRLKWIERFLDRDSDDEDDADFPPTEATAHDDDILPIPMHPVTFKPGRGKMVPLQAYPDSLNMGSPTKRIAFPSDPADARAALLSKKSVRALSYRQQKRQRELHDEDDDEVVCICNGKDDGRELVQCDACQTWYHLECIGIKNIAELGREEDPWFCRRCVSRSRSPSTEPEILVTSEPTFVPTDEQPNVRRYSDAAFFQPSLQESPNWATSRTPRTPTRVSYHGHSHSSHSWADSSRAGPSTPQHAAHAVRIYHNPDEAYNQNFDESPFDPTSTPSRGIKFHAPFATPKNNVWPRQNGPLFQTPSKPASRSSTYKAAETHAPPPSLDPLSHLLPQEHLGRPFAYDDSPIRRSKVNDAPLARRVPHSPSRSRTSGPNHFPYLEESPVVRSVGSRIPRDQTQQRFMLDEAHNARIP
ncbi:hypothetical protein M413DRAFT_232847 [Hebeloma cylindrosporum]|uniref:PHD-type domain-containing protein n=1 Tax=Hebeloma cylindrosporum TaxID=76867 RepID=A0A0C2YFG2_HEBCY|nr:hypothetical protein M413DRAFT_232847 [Hebeloma cylindrosporum h7]